MRYLSIPLLAAATILSTTPEPNDGATENQFGYFVPIRDGNECVDPGDTELTQSSSLEIVPGSGVANNVDGITSENFFARAYLMDADLSITCVRFGIETNSGGAAHPGYIAIYLDTDGGLPTNSAAHQLLGQADITITGFGILYAGNFDPPIKVVAGDQIVVELFVADGQGSVPPTGIWPGANGLGQSGPSYLNYVDLADLGYPDSYLVNTINGNSGAPPCPWDLNASGAVGTNDLLTLFAQWGQVGTPADFDGGGVSTTDLLILFANWGLCP